MFSRSPDRSAPDDPRRSTTQPTGGPLAPSPASGAQTDVTTIGREDRFEGTLQVRRLVRIAGAFKGTLEAASVIIEAGGHVDAEVVADEVVVAGEYSGNLLCRKRLEVQSSGKVSGRLETLKLVLAEGAAMDGEIHMTRPGDDSGVRPATAMRVVPEEPARSTASAESAR
jgi:cytoskeletal protein CcmA (bactofilin family)